MSKFWGFVLTIIIIGILAVTVLDDQNEITFTELETECREDRQTNHQISLTEDNTVKFEGNFELNSTKADLDYNYRRSGDRIILNIISRDSEQPEDFQRECLASGVYEAETITYQGQYTVVTQINGETIERRVINFQ